MLQNNSACDLLPWQSEDQEETKVHLHHLCMPPHPSVSSHTQKQTSLSSHLALLIQKNQSYCRNRGFYTNKNYSSLPKKRSLQIEGRNCSTSQISDGLKKRAKLLSEVQFCFQSLSKQTNVNQNKKKGMQNICDFKDSVKNKINPEVLKQTNNSLMGQSYFSNPISRSYQRNGPKQRTSFSGFVEMRRKKQRQRKQKDHIKTLQQHTKQYRSKTETKTARDTLQFFPNCKTNCLGRSVAFTAQKTKEQSKCRRIMDSRGYTQKKKRKASIKSNIKPQTDSQLRNYDFGGNGDLVIVGLLRTQQ